MNLYQEKANKYFNNSRFDLIELIPKNGNNKILEIGAGSGDTLIEIKRLKLANEVVGIELMKLADSQQENPVIDRLIFGNIESIELDLLPDYFDVILIGDVLEHLVDPWNTLKELSKFLKPKGIIIISIPNFREFINLYKIAIKADFGYEDQGIMDRTHLRFFCKKNMIKLINSANFKVESIVPAFKSKTIKSKRNTLNKITLGLFEEFLTFQYIIVASK